LIKEHFVLLNGIPRQTIHRGTNKVIALSPSKWEAFAFDFGDCLVNELITNILVIRYRWPTDLLLVSHLIFNVKLFNGERLTFSKNA
tara:strand:+ start:968 stop:1228 length:261 start_codon:yes stop_codon:yes gene_type:complete